jgi:hypothetical protein
MSNNHLMKDLIIAVAASCAVAAGAQAAPVESPIEAPGPAGALQATLTITDFLTSDSKH